LDGLIEFGYIINTLNDTENEEINDGGRLWLRRKIDKNKDENVNHYKDYSIGNGSENLN
jgi:hypothetical protein